ncbi:MAG: phosphoenolpyruvate carboxykinase (ATP), partial [Deltaproteobacteria bacterium]|nr:phosphoenolpyruvate carboxykinase (ATP) [Deltaproteobacteria bacterium]
MTFDWKQHTKAFWNLSEEALVQQALERGEGKLAVNGALVCETGKRTGRSPNDRFFVVNDEQRKNIGWGKVNKEFPADKFDRLLEKVTNYLKEREIFARHAYACASEEQRLPLLVVTELAWHNLFANQLFLRYAKGGKPAEPKCTIIHAPNFLANPSADGTNSEAFIIVNLQRRIILIGGTHYAGEIKKSIFTTLNYLLPDNGILPMHCSANVGKKGDVALFFGLSGTGKTTLSADPHRGLIGDDEHAWNDHGVFNLEGGCYAKCIRLSKEFEPQIWAAIRSGAVVENIVMNPQTGEIDFNSDAITENTRVAYPLHYIENAVIPSIGGHPKVIFFLTADAFGVLPPLSRLTPEEARKHFLLGYTAKLAGTEAGVKDPQATFSSCFGAPFLPRPAKFYGEMFEKKTAEHKTPVYLINTGWGGGPYGVGKRISLPHTRAIITACLEGKLGDAHWTPVPQFRLSIPNKCPGVPSEILDPSQTWQDKAAYKTQADK